MNHCPAISFEILGNFISTIAHPPLIYFQAETIIINFKNEKINKRTTKSIPLYINFQILL